MPIGTNKLVRDRLRKDFNIAEGARRQASSCGDNDHRTNHVQSDGDLVRIGMQIIKLSPIAVQILVANVAFQARALRVGVDQVQLQRSR